MSEREVGRRRLFLQTSIPGEVLAGVDLDTCLDPETHTITPWAQEVLDTVQSYAEISPSGTGLKVFFRLSPNDATRVIETMGGPGRQWKLPGSHHPPGIELYLGGRYFALTGDHRPETPDEIRQVSADDVLHVVEEIGPGLNPDKEKTSGGANGADEGAGAALVRLLSWATSNPRASRLLAGNLSDMGADKSASAVAFRLAGYCKDAGLSEGEARAVARAYSHVAFKHHIEDQRAWARIWERVRSKDATNGGIGPLGDPEPLVRPMEPGEPFPLEALPPIMQAGVMGIVGRTLVDPGLAAQSVMAAWSLLAQGHANIQTIGGSYAPLSLFILSIAKSGERKTTSDNLACKPVEEREAELRKVFAEDSEKQRVKLGAWQREEKKILTAKKEDGAMTEARLRSLGPPPRAPFTPLLTCPDPTFEGLCRLLAEGSGLAGVFSSEGGQFIGGHGMKEDEKKKTASNISSVWDGGAIKRVRGGDGIQILAHRRVALHLMAQPGMAAGFLGDPVLQDQGLLARFLVACPESRMGYRFFREPTREEIVALNGYTAALKRALDLPLPRQPDRPDTADPGELWPRGLKLARDARLALIEFSDYCETLLGPKGAFSNPAMSGFGNKLTEHATRLAGVFSMARNMEAKEVGLEDALAGIAVARWYADERLRIIEAGAIDPKVQAAELLRVWLFTDWEDPNISASDVAQYGPNMLRDAEKARASLELLASKSWLESLPTGGEVRGKRRRIAWRIRREAAP